MDPRSAGRRDLVFLAVAIVGLSRLADGPLLWLAAALLLVTMLLGSLQVLGECEPRGVPVESLLLPAVAAVAALGSLRLVRSGRRVPALHAGFAIDRASPSRLAEGASTPPSAGPVLVDVSKSSPAAFTGVGGWCPADVTTRRAWRR
jgi:hypothetical protein